MAALRHLSVIFLLSFTMVSCITYSGFYNVGLQSVERPEDASERYGESTIVDFQEDGSKKYRYEDDLIDVVWLPLSTQFAFSLKNKSDNSIKILWDEAVYVNESGSSSRVMHAGVKYIDRNNSQPPTIVVKNSTIEDMVVPTDNVYYISGQYGGWRTSPMFPNSATTPDELVVISNNYIGKEVQVLLPLEIQGTVNEYIFTFKVEDFVQL